MPHSRPSTHVYDDDFPYLSDVTVRHELCGFPIVLNGFSQFVSSPRLTMLGSHITQTPTIRGAEFNRLFAGYEREFGRLTFNSTERDQPIKVLRVIPKYSPSVNYQVAQIKGVQPRTTVIYRGLDDNKVGYFHINRSFIGSDGFGFEYKFYNKNKLRPDVEIPQDMVLASSPSIHGSRYAFGTNANVAYMPRLATAEDAFQIDDVLAEKLTSERYVQVVCNLRPDHKLLMLNGTPGNRKFLPDVGEFVNENGVFCATRPTRLPTYAADTDPAALTRLRAATDEIVNVPVGSQLIDLDVYVNRKRPTDSSYTQLQDYVEASITYWKSIYAAYVEFGTYGDITNTFNSLVSSAVTNLIACGIPVSFLRDPTSDADKKLQKTMSDPEIIGVNKTPVEFFQIVATLHVPRIVTNGHKITGLSGEKGVIGERTPTEDMPTDEQGFVANLVIDPRSPPARMNFSQLFEQGINRVSEFVRREAEKKFKDSPEDAFMTFIEWFTDVHPNYGKLVNEINATPKEREEFAKACIDDFPIIHIPPYLRTITFRNVLAWIRKWKAYESRVTYTVYGRNGKKRRTTTRDTVCIASKYVILLCKFPEQTASGFTRISHIGIATKSKEPRHSFPISRNPVKFIGEDDGRILAIEGLVAETARIMCLYSNSPNTGVIRFVKTLFMAEKPTALEDIDVSTKDLMRDNAILSVLFHDIAFLGVELRTNRTNLKPGDVTISGGSATIDTAEGDTHRRSVSIKKRPNKGEEDIDGNDDTLSDTQDDDLYGDISGLEDD